MSPANMALWVRDTASDLSSVPSTFSSWDKCMAKSYCKWPVIVGIIIGSVIVIGILGCIINCLCCGYQCCKCCCGCCCPSGRRQNKQPKHYDEPTSYQPPPPGPNPVYQPPAPPVYRGAVQTATFDAPKPPAAKVDEDALPAMPTWAAAVDKRVEEPAHHDDVEMEPLHPQNHPLDRKQGAGTPLHVATAFSDYPPDRTGSAPGYRGFTPTDPYARRSPGPAAALAATQDPYGRRSPGMATPGRSPGPQATMDPYGRRSPGPAAAYGAAHDPYARRSPGLTSPVGAPVSAGSPYDQQGYHTTGYDQHQPYDDDYSHGHSPGPGPGPAAAGPGYHAVNSPSPVAAYQPHTNYSPVPMAFSPSSEPAHVAPGPAGFQRQPSFGSSQYPPTYTSHPASPPPPFQSAAPSEYGAHEYGAHEYGVAVGEPVRDRPPSLLQSGRKPAPNTFRLV
ncbi:uncharacterized protein N7482_007802 [Penicillium canariense]|uniref:Uncharacterized protein n=1 Tax=Penicillium canariense TaxID=189055 RepID=A0A9W9HZR4_9EURO|nr:uncharacterized protein N7482_007802 [Penicillium canariense]KAJ5160798.1 hypothetical protein N7482_007802 [Penicillium canariense]